MLTECRVTGQWLTIEAMTLARLLELEARVRRVREYNENDLRDATRDVLMLTGAGAALAESVLGSTPSTGPRWC